MENPMIDISSMKPSGKTYDGSYAKEGMTDGTDEYIVKWGKKGDLSAFTEYVASRVASEIGISAHEVWLSNINGETVAVLKDFTQEYGELHTLENARQSSYDTDELGIHYTYDEVLHLLDVHLKMSDAERAQAKVKFWQMFILDAILGNRDRHPGNWGIASKNGVYRFAPLFDNGGSLFPNVNRTISEYRDAEARRKFIYERVYIFPASVFRMKFEDTYKKTNYEHVIHDMAEDTEFKQQLSRLKSTLTVGKLGRTVEEVVKSLEVDEYIKRFWVEIVVMRYCCLILRRGFDETYTALEQILASRGYPA